MLYTNYRDIGSRFDPTQHLHPRNGEEIMARARGRGVARDAALSDCDTIAILGAWVVCIAQQWNAKNVVETPSGSNAGGLVDVINHLYGLAKGQPWCVSAMWVIIDDAFRRANVPNPLPGYKECLGNALKTLQVSIAKGLPVDQIPAVGACFYRQSTRPGDGSSGHTGVVVGRTADGGITTIEGNQGTTNRMGQYAYTPQQIKDSGFQFIHVERTPASCAQIAAINGDCLTGAKRITAQTTIDTSTTASPRGSRTLVIGGGGGPSSSGGSSVTVNETTEQRKQRCDYYTNVQVGSIIGWEALSDLRYGADILGANFKSTESYYRSRNGIATGRRSDSGKGSDHSGIGIFKLKSGRLLYVADQGSQQLAALYEQNLIGKGYGKDTRPHGIVLRREVGDGSAERNAQMLAGTRGIIPLTDPISPIGVFNSGIQTVPEGFDIRTTSSRSLTGKLVVEIGGRTIRFSTVPELLAQLDQLPMSVTDDRPIVLMQYANPMTLQRGIQLVMQIVEIALQIAAPFADKLGIKGFVDAATGEVATLVKSAVTRLVINQERITSADVAQLLVPLANALVPNAYSPYVNKAGGLVSVYLSNSPSLDKAIQMANILGIDVKSIAGDVEAFFRDSDIGRIVSQAKDGFEAARDQLRHMGNMKMLKDVGAVLNDASIIKNQMYTAGNQISRIPALQNLFLSGVAEGALAVVPNVGMLMRESMGSNEVKEELRRGQDLVGHLSMAAIGFIREPDAYAGLVYSSLKSKAIDAFETAQRKGEKLLQFVLPPGVPETLRECYVYRLMNDSDLTISLRQHNTTIITSTVTKGSSTNTVNTGTGTFTPATSIFLPPAPSVDTGRNTSTVNTGTGILTNIRTGTPAKDSSTRIDTGTNVFTPVPDFDRPTQTLVDCPPGYTYDPVQRACVPTVKTKIPEVPIFDCPEGYYFDGALQGCVPNAQPREPDRPQVTVINCQPGYHWDDTVKACVPDPKTPDVPQVRVIDCPQGYHWDSSLTACVPDAPPIVDRPPVIEQPPAQDFDRPPTPWDPPTMSVPPVRTVPPPAPTPEPSTPSPSPGGACCEEPVERCCEWG